MDIKELVSSVGNTPIKELNSNLFVKLEQFNPSGSIKDRATAFMIEDAISSNKLTCGGTIIEATSGNTGISIAYMAQKLGYKAIIIMPDSASKERVDLMRGYGAEVILMPGKLGMKGCTEKAIELNSTIENSIILNQFENNANVNAHFMTTGREIDSFFKGQIDIVVVGIGTGGSVTGIAKYLKKVNKHVQVVGVEPENSPLLTKGVAGPHKIQGIGANFVPKILDKELIDLVIDIPCQDAFDGVKELANMYNLKLGLSSGATYMASKKLSVVYPNKKICFISADGEDRYYSLNLYEN